MGISQRETIIALEKSIDLHCMVHLVFGVQGYFLKLGSILEIQNEKTLVNTFILYTSEVAATSVRIAEC